MPLPRWCRRYCPGAGNCAEAVSSCHFELHLTHLLLDPVRHHLDHPEGRLFTKTKVDGTCRVDDTIEDRLAVLSHLLDPDHQ